MFKIGASDSYTWPVKIILPTDEGKTLEQDFLATFKRVSQTKIDEYFAQLSDNSVSEREIIKEVLIGWKNIIDDSGNQIPYTEILRDQILDGASVATQIGKAFLESLKAGRIKN